MIDDKKKISGDKDNKERNITPSIKEWASEKPQMPDGPPPPPPSPTPKEESSDN